MKKILLTSFIALGFGMVVLAQQEPAKAKVNRKAVTEQKAAQAKLQKAKIEADRVALKSTPAQKAQSAAAEKTSDQK